MFSISRRTTGALSVLLCGALTACVTNPPPQQQVYSDSGYQTRPNRHTAPRGTEYARVSRIETLRPRPTPTSGVGAVAGAVIGGVIGNQIGHGGGRAVATGVGAVGGAVVGNAIEERNSPSSNALSYRITLHMDQGTHRSYDVSSPGDLRAGDRVRVYQGQISRY